MSTECRNDDRKRWKQFIHLFEITEGRGPYLSFRSSPRHDASFWIYVRFLTDSQIFLVNITSKESGAFELYFHVNITWILLAGYF